MSYDLMVFEAKAAPKTREEFMAWYDKQTEWSEDHSYNEPSVCSAALQNWMNEMKQTFRPMNGPLSPSDEEFDSITEDEENHLTDYSMGREVIYGAFAWSLAEEANVLTRKLAEKHSVGFFDPQEGKIRFPDGTEL